MNVVLIGISILLLFGLTVWFFLQTAQFGGKITTPLREVYNRSEHWDGKKFLNLEDTTMGISPGKIPKILSQQFTNRSERSPQTPLPVLPLDHERIDKTANISFAWYGHSAVLLRIEGSLILIDPMFGPDASPIAPFTASRFSENMLEYIDDLPFLDAILITHDHYDHLDLKSILKLKSKTKNWWVSMGVGRHLQRWGIPSENIREFDWWETATLNNIHLTFTPSRHFSGRGLADRAACLWGGWVFETDNAKVYWSGDGGYGKHFREIGERFGGFDLAFMECGQYNENWHQIHMYPEEAVQAALDTNAKISVPVHWGAFNLALHHWKDPIHRFVTEARKKHIEYATPLLGHIMMLETPENHHWWDDFE